MTQSIQDFTDSLVTYANTTDDPLTTIQNLTYRTALSNLSQSASQVTQSMYLKSQRLAFLQLLEETLQAIIDTESWAEVVTAVFSDATFSINASQQQIIIEVNV